MSLRPMLAAFLVLAGCASEKSPPTAAPKSKSPPAPGATAAPLTRESTADLVRRGRAAYDAGDFRAAARAFDQVLAAEPTNRDALWHLAMTAEGEAGRLPRPLNAPYYLRAASSMRALRAAHPELTPSERTALPRILYNEACALALDGESARALVALSDSIAAGFVDLSRIESDADLDSLRILPEFQLFVGRLERWLTLVLLASTKPFPFSFSLKDVDGKPVALGDFKGKVVIVVFWGTWCPPARKEVPHLIELYKRHHKTGLEIVGLNDEVEQGEPARQVVRSFTKNAGIPFPCVIGDEAARKLVPGFRGYPTTLFIDRSGKVRLGLSGYQPFSTLEMAAAALLGEGDGSETKGKGIGR